MNELRDKLLGPTEKALAAGLVDFMQMTEGSVYSLDNLPTSEQAKELLLELTQVSPRDPAITRLVYKLAMPHVNWDNVVSKAVKIMKPTGS